ncbi:MAG: glycoside hydrolase family 16 protein [Bacteroidaceae bacterium]|nr:glycoside hydrolase family 16 protein [Bacteroidaceae bacterium]
MLEVKMGVKMEINSLRSRKLKRTIPFSLVGVVLMLVAVCFGSSDLMAKGKKRASCIVFSKKELKFRESIQREGWELVWHDEFDGKRLSDEWTRIPRFKNPSEWDKFMSSHDKLYKVKGGVLTLYGLVNDFLPEDTAHFLTGGVYTKGKVYFQRGRIDIRLKMDDASGAWPAAWLLPDGRWPHDGEIDIMERLNSDDFAHQTIHSAITEYDKEKRKTQSWHETAPIRKGDWNVYSVELYEDSVSFIINDKLTFTYRKEPQHGPEQFPYDRPMYLLLDMQLGGHWVGRINPEELPYRYQIDYVRFYKKNEE